MQQIKNSENISEHISEHLSEGESSKGSDYDSDDYKNDKEYQKNHVKSGIKGVILTNPDTYKNKITIKKSKRTSINGGTEKLLNLISGLADDTFIVDGSPNKETELKFEAHDEDSYLSKSCEEENQDISFSQSNDGSQNMNFSSQLIRNNMKSPNVNSKIGFRDISNNNRLKALIQNLEDCDITPQEFAEENIIAQRHIAVKMPSLNQNMTDYDIPKKADFRTLILHSNNVGFGDKKDFKISGKNIIAEDRRNTVFSKLSLSLSPTGKTRNTMNHLRSLEKNQAVRKFGDKRFVDYENKESETNNAMARAENYMNEINNRKM